MKYYSELMRIESEIIQLEVLKSLVRGITPGITECQREDIENVMWHLVDQIEMRHDRLRDEFNCLFDMVREDSFKEEAAKNATKTKKSGAKKPV